MPLKYEFDLELSKTLGDVFENIIELYKYNERSLNNILSAKKSVFHQTLVLRLWGMGWEVKALYDLMSVNHGFDGTLIEFMEKSTINEFTSLGWKFEKYWNEDTQELLPIIITPTGMRLKFPFQSENI